eukprot:TRINITY_DN3214_c0_g1_i3.p1 TRINITY_DN3214_c0_g1~~TRINITY_DN3214_c0_g1_i3.p1  ORF type:complete len:347 (+),score=47.01 TRINITY_DN3214_c0_g1_i3:109-1149(+)
MITGTLTLIVSQHFHFLTLANMVYETSASKSPEGMQLSLGISSWVTCSIGMMVFNKQAIKFFPVECFLVALQMATSVAWMVCFCWRSLHIGSYKDVLRWMMVVPFFTGMLLTSILALKSAPMSLVVSFRALSPLVSLTIERFYPNPLQVSGPMMASMFGMIAGVGMYARDLDKSDYAGIGWVFLNNFFAIGDRLLQRLMLAKDQSPVDISLTGITLLNNLLGMIPLLAVACLTHEFAELPTAVADLDSRAVFFVAASCIVGVGISYTGVWVQSLISATSFLVLVNANKFVIIGLEATVMRTKQLSMLQYAGACVAILASAAYGKAREAVEKASAQEKQPLVQGQKV